MFQALRGRAGHYLLLVLVWAVLSLVNLGGASLWDIDEGLNAEAAREMHESRNFVIPYFNFQIRSAKPALLYWMQVACYDTFGVNEFSARLPSALAALACVLITYELGRLLFGVGAGLIAGVVLASSLLFCGAAHFANPDALLCACNLLTMYVFWRDYESGRSRWLALGGITTGLGMLAKGPVGLILPAAIVGGFLLWERQLGRMFRRQFWWGTLLFILVAVPWYVWVSVDTRGVFLKGFFLTHNINRFLVPMENHRGPIVYYLLVLLVGFAPWSVFFTLMGWHSWKHTREQRGDPRYRFLGCWIAAYLAFFSIASTKLPNYILPLYPALALLAAHLLDRWRRGEVTLPAWGLPSTLAALVLVGVITTGSMLFAGGKIGASLLRGYHLPGMERWAAVGVIPILGAALGWWYLRAGRREGFLTAVGASAVLWVTILINWAQADIEPYKAIRPLALTLRKDAPEDDIRIVSFFYFRPSLVFYCQRRVDEIYDESVVLEMLRYPHPVYVFMPVQAWDKLRPRVDAPWRELGRHRDIYRALDVVLVGNDVGHEPGVRMSYK